MKTTIKEVAELLGQSQETIRMGLQLGVYPFGAAFKKPGKKNWTYTIYPAKVREYLGGENGTDYTPEN